MLLPHGASEGRGYGPIVVAEHALSLTDLEGKRIGVPGLSTTAYLTLRLFLPRFVAKVVPISPYARAFDAVRSGEVDAALLIHEGRLTYEREGFAKVVDLGEEWARLSGGLPLPLGGNLIRRALGPVKVQRVSGLCRDSIAWSLAHREEVITALLSEDTRRDLALDRVTLARYLEMYANDDTACFAADARAAVGELFRRAASAGLLPPNLEAEFAP
jgi:1,4-dihydroxy-6-naphthoate synthase